MGRTRRTRRRAGRLFALDALASLVPVGILGVVLVREHGGDGERHALQQGRAQAEVIEQMAVGPALRGADPDLEPTPAQLDALWSATDLAVLHGSVVHPRRILVAGGQHGEILDRWGLEAGAVDEMVVKSGR